MKAVLQEQISFQNQDFRDLQEVLVYNGWSGETKPRYRQIRYTQTLFE